MIQNTFQENRISQEKLYTFTKDSSNFMPLYFVAENGYLKIVQELIAKGAEAKPDRAGILSLRLSSSTYKVP
jgi:hypothetical protein